MTPSRLKSRISQLVIASIALYFAGGCATTDVTGPLPVKPPEYLGVPHPIGFDQTDLKALFFDPSAPKAESLKSCDSDFRKLKDLANNEDELKQGTLELVQQDPVRYHWCFFHELLVLEEDLGTDKFIDEKQRDAIRTYSFLTPIARAFAQGFNDSRYLRWAVQRYKHVSQWFFYRKLELTPRASAELVDAARPFGLWRAPAEAKPILEKYRIGQTPNDSRGEVYSATNAPATAPMQLSSPSPAQEQGAVGAEPEASRPLPTPEDSATVPVPQ